MIDLRTDFVSRPTERMLAAMMDAARDPPAFDYVEDQHVAALEALAARTLGKEDAILCPTCTMCNQIALAVQCKPGDRFVCEPTAHMATTERGAEALISGTAPWFVDAAGPDLDQDAFSRICADADTSSRPRLLVLENTHVRSGGRVISLENMQRIRKIALSHGVGVHLDGSRLFNAATYLGVPASDLAACADTVAISLNKGLSAPMGALLAGPAALMGEARVVRGLLGGNWKPAGMVAAAGVLALAEMVDRLSEDHVRARRLGSYVEGCDHVRVDLDQVQTNIVLFRVDSDFAAVEQFRTALASKDILALPFGRDTLRMVTHRDISDDDIERVREAFVTVTGTKGAGRGE